jgi:hypothetical protein
MIKRHLLPRQSRVGGLLWIAMAFLLVQVYSASAAATTLSALSAKHKTSAEYYSIVPAEFYDKINEYEFIYMYNLIFSAVDLGDESCNMIYQNCILNSENNNHVVDHNHQTKPSEITTVSTQCFPLKKAKHCLHKANFVDSECVFGRRVQDKTRLYHAHLYKNLEACVDRFPVGGAAKSGGDTAFSKQVNNGVKSRHYQFVSVTFGVLFWPMLLVVLF